MFFIQRALVVSSGLTIRANPSAEPPYRRSLETRGSPPRSVHSEVDIPAATRRPPVCGESLILAELAIRHTQAVRYGCLKPRRTVPLGMFSVTVFKVATLPINRSDAGGVIAEECLPALRRWSARPRYHVFCDGGLRYLDSEHKQFTMNPWSAPQRVDHAHLSDQVTQLAVDRWAPTPGRDFQRQYALNPLRCQRMMVSGLTTRIALRTEGKSRYSHTNISRSKFLNRNRFGSLRMAMLSC